MPAAATTLSLAYSPCPNDTYVFGAWTNGMLAGAPPVAVQLDDVESLNEAALGGRFALTKISYGAIPLLVDRYRILRSGGALGRGCGPLVIARPGHGDTALDLASLPRDARIASPGARTTAQLLLRLALGYEPHVEVMRFDRIVDAVARGDVDAGLIIHESRFTYAAAGLASVVDLGAWWEERTGRPIPLGAILVRRDVPLETAREIDATIRESLAFARDNEDALAPYVRAHAQEMDPAVMRAHIDLYVNDYTRDVGADGMAAVAELFARAAQAGLIPANTEPEFV
jgi:1,4-dihydroxy-6-naphthoate synthase